MIACPITLVIDNHILTTKSKVLQKLKEPLSDLVHAGLEFLEHVSQGGDGCPGHRRPQVLDLVEDGHDEGVNMGSQLAGVELSQALDDIKPIQLHLPAEHTHKIQFKLEFEFLNAQTKYISENG